MTEDDIAELIYRGKLEAVKEAAVSELDDAIQNIKGIGTEDDKEVIDKILDEVRECLNSVDALFAALEESCE